MERWRKGFHQKGKIYQRDLFTWCIPGRLKLLDVIVIKSHNTCNSQLSSSIVFECFPQDFLQLAPSKISKKESYDLRSLVLRSMFATVLICVSLLHKETGTLLYDPTLNLNPHSHNTHF